MPPSIHLLTAKKTTTLQPHERAYLSEKGGLGEKIPGEWAKSRIGSDRRCDKTRQMNKRGDNIIIIIIIIIIIMNFNRCNSHGNHGSKRQI